jgi:RNA polymerase sigma-70 factor, ECF subfamily
MQDDLHLAYRRYFPLLVRKCARVLQDPAEAEDLAQEAFMRLHDAALPLSDGRQVLAWLYRTSTRLALDRLRVRGRHAPEALLLDRAGGSSPERAAEVSGLWAELVRSLPERELSAGLLSHVDGLTQPEIAEVLGLHERSVRRLLVRFDECVARVRARSER